MPADEWLDVARLDPTGPGRNRSDEVPGVLRVWLAERGMSPADLTDEDVRVDLAYLGPDDGRCAVVVRVRRAALTDR
jgi:hypothetical protein